MFHLFRAVNTPNILNFSTTNPLEMKHIFILTLNTRYQNQCLSRPLAHCRFDSKIILFIRVISLRSDLYLNIVKNQDDNFLANIILTSRYNIKICPDFGTNI